MDYYRGQKLKDVSGSNIEILKIDCGGDYPIMAAKEVEPDVWTSEQYRADGAYVSKRGGPLDLEAVQ